MSRKIGWSFSRIPLDFALLFKCHVPLIEETPLAEVLEVAKRLQDGAVLGEKSTRLMNLGLGSATSHMQKDFNQLFAFDHDWKCGRYFNTRTGAGSLCSRASSIWFDADRYLDISSRLRETRLPQQKKNAFTERTSDSLAECRLGHSNNKEA